MGGCPLPGPSHRSSQEGQIVQGQKEMRSGIVPHAMTPQVVSFQQLNFGKQKVAQDVKC